jgi:glycosyltransferase involved in cell wall biosynthesis
MRVAHILRKYYPAEWGGTETALKRLLDGLRTHQAEVVVYCPERPERFARDPLRDAGHRVETFRACVPVWGISEQQRRQLISVGGNLMSFDLIWKLQRAPGLSVIHTHALNRLGGIAATVARLRRVPLVVTIHGGVLDLPAAVRRQLLEPLRGGVEWGKLFGWLLRSRRLLEAADAIMTCNRREAVLLKERFPDKIVVAQPHGVPAEQYEQDHRAAAVQAFPQLRGKVVVLAVGRIDPVKNQGWLVQQLPRALEKHPNMHLVLAGACTDEAYGKSIKKDIRNLGLDEYVTLTGGLPPGDPALIGLLQEAAVVVLPSLSETFGLVILEAWAAGTPVLATRTSGALDLVRDGENGWLFELNEPGTFQNGLAAALDSPATARQVALAGQARVRAEFDSTVLAGRVKHLYEELIGES